MNSWNAIGWLLFALLLLFCLYILGGLILTAFREAKKKRLSRRTPKLLEIKGDIGEKIILAGREWRTDFIETSYDIDFNKDRVRLEISSRREL